MRFNRTHAEDVMASNQARLAALIVLFAAACGGSDAPTLNHYANEATQSVDAAQAALSTHHDQVLAQTDVGQIRDLERTHNGDMAMWMGQLQDAMDSMMQCGDHLSSGGHPDRLQSLRDAGAAMDESIDGATAEIKRHFQAMSDAADVDAAWTEERQHQTSMTQIMDHMRTNDEDTAHAMRAMQDAGMSMMCSMATHMHHGF
jgi:hypothetical protein